VKKRYLEKALSELGWWFLRHGRRHDVWTDGDQQEVGHGDSETSTKTGRALRFSGRVFRDGSYWLAEVQVFEAMTQGRTRREALSMIEDWFSSMVKQREFVATAHVKSENEFEISATDLGGMISLLLRRQRQRSGLSLAEVAQRLGAKSRNAYARYERGDSLPTIEKLDQLLQAVSADRELLVGQSRGR
jgi:hypothetical protein